MSEPLTLSPHPPGGSDAASGRRSTPAVQVDRHPRSDVGTIVIHWIVAIAMVASLLTGLQNLGRRARGAHREVPGADAPAGEVWTVHFVAGLTLFFGITAYLVYLVRGRLTDRNGLSRLRAVRVSGRSKAARKARWGGINVALHWLIYAVTLVLTGTGVALYLGYGGWVVWLHATCALVALAYIAVHTVAHFMYGGLWQLLRLFRPAALADGAARRRRPLLAAAVIGLPVVGGLAFADVKGRSTLVVDKVSAGPDLSKLLDDPVWRNARPVSVRTMQGANFGGTGETTVEIRAVRDDANVYFAFRWWDPSRSLKRVPMIKKADGWHLLDADAARADVTAYYEDKLAVIFSRSDAFGSGGSTHLGAQPLPDAPTPLNGRGYHYTTDGSYIDMWQWKAARGGMLGVVEDMHIGPPTEPTAAERAVKGRYQAGYWGDPGTSAYRYNFKFEGPGGYAGAVEPLRLPKDWQATVARLGTVDLAFDASTSPGSAWWMVEKTETVPYSAAADAEIPVGTVMPGVLMTDGYTGDRAGISAAADWADDHWTLVASRKIATGSKYDVDFLPGNTFYLYVSAFDHTQTRHTRHMRPVEVLLR
ncbi:ethylbenzene dehydrogenase-related protein [Methylobacterium sp. NMS12]|uniref:ethylbenzene dehydrogenase-related protein n=1 Tax=Methylobacterium sp. NMS12 TaxID=3079766 RepID=UPI003F883AC3